MAPQNLHSDQDINELWFAKFFIGSMVAIACLTVILSFLPSPSGLRHQAPNKSSLLPANPLPTPNWQLV
ncbi:hypothetical protein [Pseudanabaena yagii]|uniref:Uncharacterized protein n=1 Tax=Pseudanabaena yagii GIHE-NHR1 TaxID=2722753 RepID=A0ABX1LUT6_9CYAN|nr:hypothetical protein [Pseudanabaena yagii]NMF59930.1 hypothetical protein [Pseudanabaena yagii GIHE-NHR1]